MPNRPLDELGALILSMLDDVFALSVAELEIGSQAICSHFLTLAKHLGPQKETLPQNVQESLSAVVDLLQFHDRHIQTIENAMVLIRSYHDLLKENGDNKTLSEMAEGIVPAIKLAGMRKNYLNNLEEAGIVVEHKSEQQANPQDSIELF